MRIFKCTLSLFVLLGSLGAVPAQGPDQKPVDKSQSKSANHIKSKYEKSKDRTTVTLKSMDLGGAMTKEITNLSQGTQLSLDVSFSHPGERPIRPVAFLTMKFISRSRYPVFQRRQNVIVVIDDATTIPLGDTAYKSDSQTFYMDEILEIKVTYDAMKRATEATSFKLILGNREIKFRNEQLDDLREITARMSP